MSKTGVIAALVVAVVLAVTAAIVLKPNQGPPARQALFAFRPSDAVAIAVTTSGGDEQAIERERRGGWSYLASDGGRWPINRVRIDNALRKLAELSAEHDADKGTDWKSWPSFTVTLQDGGAWQMWCEPSEIGGHRSVRVGPPSQPAFTARVEGAILKALIETGVAEWREKLALPGLSLDVTRIRLEAAAGTIALAKNRGQWRLIEPVANKADTAAVSMLLRYLAAVEVSRFVSGEVDRAALGLDAPTSVAIVEREIVSGPSDNPVRRMEQRKLIIGGATDVATTRFSAEVTRTLSRPDGTVVESASTIVEVGTKGLQRINPSATNYLSKRAADVSASNVGAITIKTVSGDTRFDRTIDGWFKRTAVDNPDDRERLLLNGETHIARFLEQICDTDATSVSIGRRADVQEVCEFVLGSLGGQPLETLSLGHTVAGDIIASKDGVYWVLAGGFEETIAWLIEQASGSDGG